MRLIIFCCLLVWSILNFTDDSMNKGIGCDMELVSSDAPEIRNQEKTKEEITAMEALDLVKECYAMDFDKVIPEDGSEEYYYKLPLADYYLTYDRLETGGKNHIIHLYEFVMDDPQAGIGHTVTYGWYAVDVLTGEITDRTWYE